MFEQVELDTLCINTIRTLAMDGVQKANSGHPGAPMGMALAERFLAAKFNKPGYDIVDHYTYVMAGDGDLMEGVSAEAGSLAGHLKLGKLICCYDDNSITIEGHTDLAFTENVGKRYEAYGWHVQYVEQGDDPQRIATALEAARQVTERPSLICIKTHIAHGSPNKQDSHKAHGAPLGTEEIRLTKDNLGWPSQEPFSVPEAALAMFRKAVERGQAQEDAWNEKFAAYRQVYPELAQEWEVMMGAKLPEGWESALPEFSPEKTYATRVASGEVLNVIAAKIPGLLGGSADLGPSNNTTLKGYDSVSSKKYDGRNVHYDVREHAMGAVMNGLALHGSIIPYGGTFLVFADYVRPAIRLSAMMKQQVIYVFTHDSIGLGEDGPTHQPVEHLLSLRAIPHLLVLRPADATETAGAWKVALERKNGPSVLVLSRQGLPTIQQSAKRAAEQIAKGAYVLAEADNGTPEVILIATGSEVGLAMEVKKALEAEGKATRVVSMPSWELFEQRPLSYQNEILPPAVTARLAIEARSPLGWRQYVGDHGDVISIDTFGASAPAKVLLEQYGFTAAQIVSRALKLLA